jgi:hypothetical protein
VTRTNHTLYRHCSVATDFVFQQKAKTYPKETRNSVQSVDLGLIVPSVAPVSAQLLSIPYSHDETHSKWDMRDAQLQNVPVGKSPICKASVRQHDCILGRHDPSDPHRGWCSGRHHAV